jgi:putative mycofactocin binding protein MftB
VSTKPAPSGLAVPFDLDLGWRLHPQVAVRPERFGALLYHFGTRRLSFLKHPALLTVLESLDTAPTARAACADAGIAGPDLPAFRAALATLAASTMIEPRSATP